MTEPGKRLRLTEAQLNTIKDAASIASLAERYGVTWDARKSRPARGDYWACCPFHAERSASFHVIEAKGCFKCFGCGEKGDVFALAQKLLGLNFLAAVEAVSGGAIEPDPELVAARERARREREAHSKREAAVRLACAVEIWNAAVPINGTPATRYLRRARHVRGFLGTAELRFHPGAPLAPYEPQKSGRCAGMVAAIRDAAGAQIGSHLTFLQRDGGEKRCFAHLDDDARMMCGEHVGGFIRLGRLTHAAVIGEGVESTLSASDACGLPGLAAINAANMRAIVLPPTIRRAVIAHDRDAKRIGELSAEALAQRLWADGVAVEMLPPPDGFKDWNDAAQAGALPVLEACA